MSKLPESIHCRLQQHRFHLGTVLGINLGFLQLIGWFTLAVYILNELTSIVENMVALGVDVPEILVRGLAAARTAVDEAGDKVVPGDKAE